MSGTQSPQNILPFAKFVGNTPCVRLTVTSTAFGRSVYGKIEMVNPTGSHKDRESLEVIRDALQKGYREIGCASTGNAAISLAALSRMSGLRCHIYVSTGIWHEKLALIRAFRPVIHMIRGDYHEAVERSKDEMLDDNIYAANPGQCKAKVEGNRNIGREISHAIKPDFIVCPANNGTHFLGVWQGITENKLAPAAIAATAEQTKIADSIGGFHKYEGQLWERTITESRARVINVSDREIQEAMRLLLREGLVVEPAAATSIAALKRVDMPKDAVVCCTITGTGLKFPHLLQNLAR